jgi:hypothetical protein
VGTVPTVWTSTGLEKDEEKIMNDAEKLVKLADFFEGDDGGITDIQADLIVMADKINAFGGNIPKRFSLEYREQWGEVKDDTDVVEGIFSRMDDFNKKGEDNEM